MTELAHSFLGWTQAHPGWALGLLFTAALLDAVFLLGVFVPAGLVLFAVGTLVALDALPLWTAVLVAAAGGLAGDSLSFWIGRRYGEALFEQPWLHRRRALLTHARGFFERHGGKGVLIGRFLGPLRAVLPTVAGTAGMRWSLFLAADATASTAWALAFILPGVVFGASIGLAAEVAGRLALLLAATALLVWGAVTLTRIGLLSASLYAERWTGFLLDRSRRYRRLGLFGPVLADPQQPETPVLLLLALVLWLAGGAALFLTASPTLHAYPWPTDATVFQALRELHTPYGLEIATRLMQLGEWPVYGPVAGAMLVSLIVQGKARAAAHWVAAIAFGWGLSVGLTLIPSLPAPFAYFGLPAPPGHSERDLVLAIVIYAFLPVVLATRQVPRTRSLDYAWVATVIVLIIAARLYLGAQWGSQAFIDLLIALVWTALLGLGLRRHRPAKIHRGRTRATVVGVFFVAAGLAWGYGPEYPSAPPNESGSLSWTSDAGADYPEQRRDITGRARQPLNLLWAGDLTDIENALRAQGWSAPPAAASPELLRWLSADAPIATRPVLPQVHRGARDELRLRRDIASRADRQLLLRLWPARAQRADAPPIWIGALVLQESRAVFGGLLHYPLSISSHDPRDALAFAEPKVRRGTPLYFLSTPGVDDSP
jgi:membrane protein DedA with SNARE-associated domain